MGDNNNNEKKQNEIGPKTEIEKLKEELKNKNLQLQIKQKTIEDLKNKDKIQSDLLIAERRKQLAKKSEPKPEKPKPLKVVGKLFPTKVLTRDGNYYIGDYKVEIDKDALPFNSLDNVDFYLTGIFDYSRDAADSSKGKQIDMRNYFKHFKNDTNMFLPIPYGSYEKKKAQEAEEAAAKVKLNSLTEKLKGGKSRSKRLQRRQRRTRRRRKSHRSRL